MPTANIWNTAIDEKTISFIIFFSPR